MAIGQGRYRDRPECGTKRRVVGVWKSRPSQLWGSKSKKLSNHMLILMQTSRPIYLYSLLTSMYHMCITSIGPTVLVIIIDSISD